MTTIVDTFRSGEPSLARLLEEIHNGDIQLPDFQRSWVWDDYRIRSLIASVSLSYPIGVIMLLETDDEIANFKCRFIEDAPKHNNKKPSSLILDGQQRMTALYSVLRSGKEVSTKTERGKEIKRVYYLNIADCLNADIDRVDAVISLPPERKKIGFDRAVLIDASTVNKEYEFGLFPLDVLLDDKKFSKWKRGYTNFFGLDNIKVEKFDDFCSNVRQRFLQYDFATITLLKGTSREAVCQIFEKVNTGGVVLTVFELMTATYAKDNFNLREDWKKHKEKFERKENYNKILSSVEATDFLQAVSLLATHKGTATSCKRKDILKIKLSDYKNNSSLVENGFISAAEFLMKEKIFDKRGLPYRTQLIPLAAVCASIGDFKNYPDTTKEKLARWYWCSVFSELYGGATETRAANDFVDLLAWLLEGGKEPRSLIEANFSPTRLLGLQSRQSAAYKGMMALLMKLGSEDFITGNSVELNNFFEEKIDIHHIFPKSYCLKRKYRQEHWNSVANKSAISALTNKTIGGKAPSKYLGDIISDGKVDATRLDSFLLSHAINPSLLREDKFEEFILDRSAQLLLLIEKAMGKKTTGWDSDEVVNGFGKKLTRPATR